MSAQSTAAQTPSTLPTCWLPNVSFEHGSPTLADLLRAGGRGDFARELYLAAQDLGNREQLTRAFARADQHNRAALDQAYLRATSWRLSQVIRVEANGGGLPVLGPASLKLLGKALRQEFLAVALAVVACGPASILARLPIRTPDGYDGREQELVGAEPGSIIWDRAWAVIARRYRDTACTCSCCGERWQYMGSVRYSAPVGWAHQFRHRHLCDDPDREPARRYLWVICPSPAEDMAASLPARG